ncbi:MAG: cytochrome P450, partial [Candidatus Binatia bacterium]|nr:cytochrome P450 [Candidatus Binatia bacterium]
MSEQDEKTADFLDPNVWTPEMEMAEAGGGVSGAADLALDEINLANPHLFRENRWHEHFARLRAEDPIHFNELESAGRYWSITKYDDVRAVDSDWQRFSSA